MKIFPIIAFFVQKDFGRSIALEEAQKWKGNWGVVGGCKHYSLFLETTYENWKILNSIVKL